MDWPRGRVPSGHFRLDARRRHGYAWSVEKKTARVLKKIQTVSGLSEAEKFLFARSLAATPDERWQFHENFLRSHDLFTRSARKRYGFRS